MPSIAVTRQADGDISAMSLRSPHHPHRDVDPRNANSAQPKRSSTAPRHQPDPRESRRTRDRARSSASRFSEKHARRRSVRDLRLGRRAIAPSGTRETFASTGEAVAPSRVREEWSSSISIPRPPPTAHELPQLSLADARSTWAPAAVASTARLSAGTPGASTPSLAAATASTAVVAAAALPGPARPRRSGAAGRHRRRPRPGDWRQACCPDMPRRRLLAEGQPALEAADHPGLLGADAALLAQGQAVRADHAHDLLVLGDRLPR